MRLQVFSRMVFRYIMCCRLIDNQENLLSCKHATLMLTFLPACLTRSMTHRIALVLFFERVLFYCHSEFELTDVVAYYISALHMARLHIHLLFGSLRSDALPICPRYIIGQVAKWQIDKMMAVVSLNNQGNTEHVGLDRMKISCHFQARINSLTNAWSDL